MNVKNKLREYLLLRSHKTDFRPNDYRGFDAVKNIAIAFEAGDHDGHIIDFTRKMEGAGKAVNLMAFIPKRRKEIVDFPKYEHFTRTEINWLGMPKSDDVKRFLEHHYGVYIALNTKNDSPLEFISAGIKADFSIGLRNPCFTRFDLVLESRDPFDLHQVFRDVEYYLNLINRQS